MINLIKETLSMLRKGKHSNEKSYPQYDFLHDNNYVRNTNIVRESNAIKCVCSSRYSFNNKTK